MPAPDQRWYRRMVRFRLHSRVEYGQLAHRRTATINAAFDKQAFRIPSLRGALVPLVVLHFEATRSQTLPSNNRFRTAVNFAEDTLETETTNLVCVPAFYLAESTQAICVPEQWGGCKLTLIDSEPLIWCANLRGLMEKRTVCPIFEQLFQRLNALLQLTLVVRNGVLLVDTLCCQAVKVSLRFIQQDCCFVRIL